MCLTQPLCATISRLNAKLLVELLQSSVWFAQRLL
jgi:hypothetical protein